MARTSTVKSCNLIEVKSVNGDVVTFVPKPKESGLPNYNIKNSRMGGKLGLKWVDGAYVGPVANLPEVRKVLAMSKAELNALKNGEQEPAEKVTVKVAERNTDGKPTKTEKTAEKRTVAEVIDPIVSMLTELTKKVDALTKKVDKLAKMEKTA